MAGSIARGRIMAQTSAKHPREPGFGHWRWQRISAVATLGLMLYFTYLVASMGPLDYSAAMAFVAAPNCSAFVCDRVARSRCRCSQCVKRGIVQFGSDDRVSGF